MSNGFSLAQPLDHLFGGDQALENHLANRLGCAADRGSGWLHLHHEHRWLDLIEPEPF